MSHKRDKIAAVIETFQGQDLDAHYLGFFDCFNRQLYFEAHEVLETLWLRERGRAEDRFYKGLIQLAGAFVHIQKQRPGPAAALLRLAGANLSEYPPVHQRLALDRVQVLIERWLRQVSGTAIGANLIEEAGPPRLELGENCN